jgi:hypothetical protein
LECQLSFFEAHVVSFLVNLVFVFVPFKIHLTKVQLYCRNVNTIGVWTVDAVTQSTTQSFYELWCHTPAGGKRNPMVTCVQSSQPGCVPAKTVS